MKKHLFFVVICCLSHLCVAKKQETAYSILDKVLKNRYFQMDFMSKTFHQSSTDPESEVGASVTVCDKMYYLKTNDLHIICDSKTIWTHLLLENEVQITKADSEINFWQVLYNCTKYYSVDNMQKIVDSGKSYYIIYMTACDSENEFLHLVLQIDAGDMVLKELKLYEKDGTLYVFNVLRYQSIPKLPKESFTFSTKNNSTAEVVDLR